MHAFLLYFGLPAGAVYSNLVASVVCVGVAWWRIRARMISHHLHQLREQERHHRELKAYITATARRPPKRLLPRSAPQPPSGGGISPDLVE